MKLIAAVLSTAVSGLLTIPLLAGGTTGRSLAACGDVPRVLDTIRTLESGGNYTAKAAHASASGAYQIIDSTWAAWSVDAGITTPYAHASEAPPDVQDAVAGYHVRLILDQYQEVSYVPLAWYYPAAIGNPVLMDTVPAPEAGNILTPRQYQTRWMDVYNSKAADGTIVCGPLSTDGQWSLPLDRSLLEANPAGVNAPHHDYPAWDFGVPIGTPVYAVDAGTVTHVTTWNGNCYADESTCVEKCGTGITIQDDTGVHWIYCHASQLEVATGDRVAAGQEIMRSGNTGHSSGPHFHLGIRINGVDVCPQPLLEALLHASQVPSVEGLPATGCSS